MHWAFRLTAAWVALTFDGSTWSEATVREIANNVEQRLIILHGLESSF